MSPANVLEPTCRRLRQALICGAWPGGTRLETGRLAKELGVSMTPVRDCLNQLVGEALVDFTPGEGFRVPLMTERELRELLLVNELLLLAAAGPEWRHGEGFGDPAPASHADRLDHCFRMLATGSGNRTTWRIVQWIGERLHRVRMLEPEVLPKSAELAERILNSLDQGARQRRIALRDYHRQCLASVPRLIDRLAG